MATSRCYVTSQRLRVTSLSGACRKRRLAGARGWQLSRKAYGEFRGAVALRTGGGGPGRQSVPGHLHCEQVRGLGLEREPRQRARVRAWRPRFAAPPGLRPPWGDLRGAPLLPPGPLPPPRPDGVSRREMLSSAPFSQDLSPTRPSLPAQCPAPSVAGLRPSGRAAPDT